MNKVWILVIVAIIPYVVSLPVTDDGKYELYSIQQVPQNEIEERRPDPFNRIYTGQSKFAVALLKSLSKSSVDKSHIISPHSIYRALLLAYFGAEAKTKESLESSLFLDWAMGSRFTVAKEFDIEWRVRAERHYGHEVEFSTVEEIYVTKAAELK